VNQADQTMLTAIIAAFSGIAGIIIGTILAPWIGWFFDKRKQASQQKIDALRKQLEVYRPLYEKLVIMPQKDPEHYFCDWEEAEFHDWLSTAVDLMLPNLHLLPNEVLEKIHGYRETTVTDHFSCESDVRWLYKHIEDKFKDLRKQLKIE
jgi:hypothetical protein